MIKILAISGSLRKISSNTTLLRAAAMLAPSGVDINLCTYIGQLPHFNPDMQGNEPQLVIDFHKQVTQADGLLISTPEYAHGVPGVLKNALDWLVSNTEFAYKPVMLLNASSRAAYAQASLVETLTVMSAKIITGASATIPLLGKSLNENDIVSNPEMAATICRSLDCFVNAIKQE